MLDEGLENEINIGNLANSAKNICGFRGDNNRIIIEDGADIRHLRIVFRGNDNVVKIQRSSKVKGGGAVANASFVHIGRRATVGSGFDVIADGSRVLIRHDCMIA
ncbi:hypothetical protein [Aeromonas veronii]|uniref:hypothetical protein n=1 Tax=Aeromonas veronii TaxID=654 RepID=UPI003BA07DC7